MKFNSINKKIIAFTLVVLPVLGLASGDGNSHVPHLDGTLANLSIFWVIPFVGILLSIAIIPLFLPELWHHHYGKVSLFWVVLFVFPCLVKEGLNVTGYELLHVGLLEYIPFIILLLSLFTISGGICLTGTLVGKPIVNVIIIFVGTVLASWMGTTGAAMLLIRPLIRANKQRQHKVHVIVFFIFLVANIGGSLTPLGDPPLFLGFLKGVDFFWTTKAMFLPMLFMVISLLIIFFIMDTIYYRKEKIPELLNIENHKLGLEGSFNIILIAGVVGAVLLSGFWDPHVSFTCHYVEIELQNLIRDILLLTLAYASWVFTPQYIRENNEYTWFPIVEVAKLFAGIFVTIIPAIAILKAGTHGALASVVSSVSTETGEAINYMYFWLTGVLSSFLDNAPTYLVFFNTAGGDPVILMGELYDTLLAISTGAVFMGANTYIGNAPNFMVKSISESAGFEMPSFFGYLVKWSLPILFPLFILVSLIFF